MPENLDTKENESHLIKSCDLPFPSFISDVFYILTASTHYRHSVISGDSETKKL